MGGQRVYSPGFALHGSFVGPLFPASSTMVAITGSGDLVTVSRTRGYETITSGTAPALVKTYLVPLNGTRAGYGR